MLFNIYEKNREDDLVVYVLVNKFFWFVKECIMSVVDLGYNDFYFFFFF